MKTALKGNTEGGARQNEPNKHRREMKRTSKTEQNVRPVHGWEGGGNLDTEYGKDQSLPLPVL